MTSDSFIVNEEEDGLRLDKLLTIEIPGYSRSYLQGLLKDGNVLVNGKSAKASMKMKENDAVSFSIPDKILPDIVPENLPLDILYEDKDVLVVNKPKGMVVHPAPGHYTKTLVNALLYRFNISKTSNMRPGIVHRLDKDTSGLMLVAKNEETHEKLASMIANKEVERHYLAITEGVIKSDTGTIDAPIGRDPNNRQKMQVTDVNAKNAITHFKVLERFKKNTLIECILETGRTHQIRVHLAYIGYPILNDPTYSKGKCSEFGQMLHSTSIKFKHPRTNEELYFKVEPPQEFKDKLEELEEE